ncbi:RagB/SusD family nutrient uptake outer membrane protein [Leyella stercorea]
MFKRLDLNISATDYRMLWPIPKDEVEVNKKLKQNPGY